jgi:fused signal recognition particle receptor
MMDWTATAGPTGHALLAQAADGGVGVEWIVAAVAGAAVLVGASAWVVRKARSERDKTEGPAKPRVDKAAAPGGREPSGAKAPVSTASAPPGSALAKGLEKTRREGFVSRLGGLFKGRELDAGVMDEVEAVLYTADIGVRTVDKLMTGLTKELAKQETGHAERAWSYLRQRTTEIVGAAQKRAPADDFTGHKPYVVMVVGVNGTGKTTSIGKLASRLRTEGKRVLLVAGDTFRAAAVEQLEVWSRRAGVDIWKGEPEADPASVVFDGVQHAQSEGYDVVLVDTAGRLHTSANLVKELQKVHRVMAKAMESAPHEVWLVLDSTMGQNAIQQARIFLDAVQVTAIVLTKLDGTAKGGVVIGICDEMGLPIRYVGIGERVEDLRPFEVDAFVDALFGESR